MDLMEPARPGMRVELRINGRAVVCERGSRNRGWVCVMHGQPLRASVTSDTITQAALSFRPAAAGAV